MCSYKAFLHMEQCNNEVNSSGNFNTLTAFNMDSVYITYITHLIKAFTPAILASSSFFFLCSECQPRKATEDI
jgi:hypothetical protein